MSIWNKSKKRTKYHHFQHRYIWRRPELRHFPDSGFSSSFDPDTDNRLFVQICCLDLLTLTCFEMLYLESEKSSIPAVPYADTSDVYRFN